MLQGDRPLEIGLDIRWSPLVVQGDTQSIHSKTIVVGVNGHNPNKSHRYICRAIRFNVASGEAPSSTRLG